MEKSIARTNAASERCESRPSAETENLDPSPLQLRFGRSARTRGRLGRVPPVRGNLLAASFSL